MVLLLPLLLACSLIFPVATTVGREIADPCTSQTNDFQHLNSTGLHLTLHHPQSPCSPAPLPSDLPFSAVIAHDAARIARLTTNIPSHRPTSLHRNNLADSLAATVPLAPGTSVGVGNYITRLGLGTPATLYAMVVDTGSSLTWLQCSPCVKQSSSDTCFKGQASQLHVPAVDMAFTGGATLKLAPRNVLIDVDESTTCLAFAATDDTAIIGNTQQQTFSVVYDVTQSRIGFAAGGCS